MFIDSSLIFEERIQLFVCDERICVCFSVPRVCVFVRACVCVCVGVQKKKATALSD